MSHICDISALRVNVDTGLREKKRSILLQFGSHEQLKLGLQQLCLKSVWLTLLLRCWSRQMFDLQVNSCMRLNAGEEAGKANVEALGKACQMQSECLVMVARQLLHWGYGIWAKNV